jgi:glycosyltransferase involved in cell wall biosynthesis
VRILVLHHYVPYPLDHGGSLRSHGILQALVEEHELSFLALGAADAAPADDWPLAAAFDGPPEIIEARSTELSARGRALRRLAPRPWLGRPAAVRSTDLPALWNRIAELPLDGFDAVQSKDLHLLPYLVALRRAHPHLTLVLDLDDVQSEARRLRLESWPRLRVSRARVWVDYRRLTWYEHRYLRLADSVWVCKHEDVDLLAPSVGRKRLECVPNVVDAAALTDAPQPVHPPRLLFVGRFDVVHNDHGVAWLHGEVWPLVRSAAPEAELWLVGKSPTPQVLALHDPAGGIHVVGDAPDIRPHLRAATISLVPVRFGSGTRLKVLEAMAARVPVVSTSLGASGLGVVDGVHCLMADDAAAFAAACVSLLGDDRRREQLAREGRALVEARFDRDALATRVTAIYRELAARKRIEPTPELS